MTRNVASNLESFSKICTKNAGNKSQYEEEKKRERKGNSFLTVNSKYAKLTSTKRLYL